MRPFHVAFILTVLTLGTFLAGQEAGYKDLSREEPNTFQYLKWHSDPTCGSIGGGSVGSLISDPPPSHPLKLAVVELENGTLDIGSDLMAHLRLENVGKETVQLPWLLDARSVEQPDENGKYQYSDASLLVTVRQGKYSGNFQTPVRLYGTKADRDSWIEVRPGEWLELRVKFSLNCDSALLGCKGLASGPAQVGFAWSEDVNKVSYERCSVSTGSERSRYVTSEIIVRDLNFSKVNP